MPRTDGAWESRSPWGVTALAPPFLFTLPHAVASGVGGC